jgi:hypothetical protein
MTIPRQRDRDWPPDDWGLCKCQGSDLPHLPRLCACIRHAATLAATPPQPAPASGLAPGWAARQAAQPDPHRIGGEEP